MKIALAKHRKLDDAARGGGADVPKFADHLAGIEL